MRWLTLQQLKSKNPATRLQMVEKLAAAEDPDSLETLISVISDEDVEVRKAAIKAVGRFRSGEAVEPLIGALRDENAEVRKAAATALKTIGDKNATLPLVSALKDPVAAVRYHAMSALDGLSWVPRNDTERAMRCVAQGKIRQAADFGVFAIEALVGELQTGVHYKRVEAVEALARIGDPRVIRPLTAALKDEDPNVRSKALEALGRVGDARAAEALSSALTDSDSRVRAAAVEALGKRTDSRSLKALGDLLGDKSPEVRKAAVESLSKMSDPGVVDLLLKGLNDADADVRSIAVSALGKLNDARAITPLVSALTDAHENVRQAAEKSLNQLNKDWEKSEEAMRAVPSLEAAAQHKDQWARRIATTLLKRIVGEIPVAAAPVEEEEQTPISAAPATAGVGVVQLFSALLTDTDRDLRIAGIHGLTEMLALGAVPMLVQTLQDTDQWVRAAAARSLAMLQWQPQSEEEQFHWLIAAQQWEELAAKGAAAVAPLISAAQEKSVQLRCRIAETLGKINDPSAVEPLMLLLNDAEKVVRRTAAHALVQMGPNRLNEAQQLVLGYELAH